jgi:hypothetical protein
MRLTPPPERDAPQLTPGETLTPQLQPISSSNDSVDREVLESDLFHSLS